MNRIKTLALTLAGAAMLLSGVTMLSSSNASAAYRTDPPGCTFCGSRIQSCFVMGPNGIFVYGEKTCFYPIGGADGSCPPCGPCIAATY